MANLPTSFKVSSLSIDIPISLFHFFQSSIRWRRNRFAISFAPQFRLTCGLSEGRRVRSSERRMQKLLLTIFLCGCVSSTAQAPQPKSAGSSVHNQQPTPGRGVITRQPPVLGDSISQLIDRLISAGGLKGKDEFETTEQYEARRKTGAAKHGTLVFALPPDTPNLTYSADTHEMTVN